MSNLDLLGIACLVVGVAGYCHCYYAGGKVIMIIGFLGARNYINYMRRGYELFI